MSGKYLPVRRIVVKVTTREKGDPAALLTAVRNALSSQGISLQVRSSTDTEAIEAEIVKDEPLETKARQIASSALDDAAAAFERKAMEHRLKSERMAEEIIAQRQGARKYLGFLAMKSIRITVEVYEKAADLTKMVVKSVTSFIGGTGEKKE